MNLYENITKNLQEYSVLRRQYKKNHDYITSIEDMIESLEKAASEVEKLQSRINSQMYLVSSKYDIDVRPLKFVDAITSVNNSVQESLAVFKKKQSEIDYEDALKERDIDKEKIKNNLNESSEKEYEVNFVKKHLMQDESFINLYNRNKDLLGNMSFEDSIDTLVTYILDSEFDPYLDKKYLDYSWLEDKSTGKIYNLDDIWSEYREIISAEVEEAGETLNENDDVWTDSNGFLEPRFDSASSFYKKARVDGDKLYSYDTLVAEIKNGEPKVYSWSMTTGRHIKDWLLQLGFKARDKKQILADYGSDTELKEAVITDYIKEDDLDKYIKANTILGEFSKYDILDDMIMRFEGNDGVALYKVILNDDNAFEFTLIDEDGNKVGSTIPLIENEELLEEITFDTLSEDQKRELKGRYYIERNENVSWNELANIEELVSDEEIKNEYGNISFVKEDFFSEADSLDNCIKTNVKKEA